MNENNNDAIFKRVHQLFKLAMGNDVDVKLNTEKDMISEWDSINHLNLIVELENEYNLNLSMEEIEHIHNVKQIVELVSSKKS
jgi:acyl carrier protein